MFIATLFIAAPPNGNNPNVHPVMNRSSKCGAIQQRNVNTKRKDRYMLKIWLNPENMLSES